MLSVKAYVEPILAYLPKGIPHHTDHGLRHSNNLLRLLVDFTKNFPGFVASQEEKLLLYLAIHLHDVGCILGRFQHNKKSIKLLRHRRFSFLEDRVGKDLLACLNFVILSHSSDYDLSRVPRQPIHSNVRLRLICAIFRLLDECDISSARISKALYDILTTYSKLNPKSLPFWEAHLNILTVIFRENDIIIGTGNLTKTRALIGPLRNKLKKINIVFEEEGFPRLNLNVVKLRFR